MAITRTDGFVDLRVSPTVSGRADEDSVWPSFTDIMTVVVRIFLVALVIILMRNTELVGQLRESVSQTETMTTQRSDMEMRIATLGDEVVRLRSVLAQAEAERSAAEETIVLKEGEISALLNDVGALQKVREALASEKAGLAEELAAVEDERQQLTTEKAALSEELAGVIAQSQNQLEQLAASEGVREQLSLDLTSLNNALSELQSEQRRLILAAQAQAEDQATVVQTRDALLRDRDALAEQVNALEVTRSALRTEVSALRNEMAGLVRTSVSTELALEESRLEGEELTARLTETALEYKLTKEELAYLRAQYADEVEAFSKERELLVAAHKTELDILRERHSNLESKYNRLVRPARSTVGRFVVEVHFRKEGDSYRYALRPASGVETPVTEAELHQQLTALKARYGDKLYTKVMLDNSLSHGEAWRFTSKIHNRYDYYYQD